MTVSGWDRIGLMTTHANPSASSSLKATPFSSATLRERESASHFGSRPKTRQEPDFQ
jgi:hypothetical protein